MVVRNVWQVLVRQRQLLAICDYLYIFPNTFTNFVLDVIMTNLSVFIFFIIACYVSPSTLTA